MLYACIAYGGYECAFICQPPMACACMFGCTTADVMLHVSGEVLYICHCVIVRIVVTAGCDACRRAAGYRA